MRERGREDLWHVVCQLSLGTDDTRARLHARTHAHTDRQTNTVTQSGNLAEGERSGAVQSGEGAGSRALEWDAGFASTQVMDGFHRGEWLRRRRRR